MSTCPKIPYESKGEALAALRRAVKRRKAPHAAHKATHRETYTYRCEECHAWHLTSTKRRKKVDRGSGEQ